MGPPGLVSEHVEGGLLVNAMSLHQDALGSFGDRPAGEGAFQQGLGGAFVHGHEGNVGTLPQR
jgi:hypothetical protein